MEKVSLPINPAEKQKLSIGVKTKIVALWMMTIGGIVVIFFSTLLVITREQSTPIGPLLFVFNSPPAALFFLAGLLLFLKRKRWAWWFATIISIGVMTFYSILFCHGPGGFGFDILSIAILLLPFSSLISLIFLLLDRKNFYRGI